MSGCPPWRPDQNPGLPEGRRSYTTPGDTIRQDGYTPKGQSVQNLGLTRRISVNVFEYIELFYNPKRKHTNNGMLSPVDFEIRQQKLTEAGV